MEYGLLALTNVASHTCRAAIIHYEGLLGDRYGEGIPQATRRRGLARSGVPAPTHARDHTPCV